jgi:NAD(P)-dependent dehydrogenase (short-subunit alcohol dehydrogenase family)
MSAGHPGRPDLPLEGQVALVTGGGRGIGRAIALALSDAGAAVGLCARSSGELANTANDIAQRGGRAAPVVADVTVRADVEQMVADVESAVGPVDVLVNNAGLGVAGSFAAMDPDEWWRVIEVNLRGPLYCSRAVLPGMLARGRGRIINISSGAGFQAWPMVSSYAVSKAALFRFTENLSAETASQGVKVFAVNPGLVRTAMSEGALACGQPSVEQSFRDAFANGLDIPAERPAQLVVSLAAGAADTLSGRYVSVETNLEETLAHAAEIVEQDLYVLRPRATSS